MVLQTNPRGVEGVTAYGPGTGPQLQTNPRGVEGELKSESVISDRSYRRTLVGLKGPKEGPDDNGDNGYRRTLVGLKDVFSSIPCLLELLQTNPRGVEGADRLIGNPNMELQTNPRGVEGGNRIAAGWVVMCYRRTLVGLKGHY